MRTRIDRAAAAGDDFSPGVFPSKIRNLVDQTGVRLGIMTIESYSHFDGRYHFWNAVCDCGVRKKIGRYALSGRKRQSCGCLAEKIRMEKRTKHGQHRTRTYSIWCGMHTRCRASGGVAWVLYGGRGIRVCTRWKSFANFLEDMGPAPDGMSLDRIDVDGNYEPSNCRWASTKQQANNKRTNHRIAFNGEEKTLAQWAESLGIKADTLHSRIRRGVSLERAMTSERLVEIRCLKKRARVAEYVLAGGGV